MGVHAAIRPSNRAQISSSGDTIPDDDAKVVDTHGSNVSVSNKKPATDNATASDDPMRMIGRRSRELIQVIKKLELLNIDQLLSVPKFVVVGNQGAGKSSMIEALSDITVPRDEGTCTRCPFQITTSASADRWQCTVSLIHKYSYSPLFKAGKDTTKYSGWQEQEPSVYSFVTTLHDKQEVEESLRRAQLAILNPHQDPAIYAGHHWLPQRSQTKVGFSPNIISIEIKGPELPELSFIDLPGAINVQKEGKDEEVVFVEKLIKNYLRDEKALVLLACSADSDVENSTAFRFVNECKARSRCIGVLTKPDLVGRRRWPLLEDVLDGKTFQLGGKDAWFVTKQLTADDLELGVTHAEARKREREFFSSQEPWISTLSRFATRFGIWSLRDAISNKLTTHILNELPKIQERVQNRLKEVDRELAQFPDRPLSASHEVKDQVDRVYNAIVYYIRGDAVDNDFRKAYKGIIDGLLEQLKKTGPEVVLITPGYMPPSLTILSDDDERPVIETPIKRAKGNNGLSIRNTPSFSNRTSTETPRTVRPKPQHQDGGAAAEGAKTIFKLDQVKYALDRASASGLPGQTDPRAVDRLVKQSIQGWPLQIEKMLDTLKALIMNMLNTGIGHALAAYRPTQLYIFVCNIVQTLANNLIDEQFEKVRYMVSCITHRPLTHCSNWKRRIEIAKRNLVRDRQLQRLSERYESKEAASQKVPSAKERDKTASEEAYLKEELGEDEYEREIAALAIPIAFYALASESIVDYIANLLEYGLLYGIERILKSTLCNELNITDEEHCVQLLAEDDQHAARRRYLVEEKRKLVEMMKELQSLPLRTRGS